MSPTNGTFTLINADRLWGTLMEMACIGAGKAGGSNRQALTDADRDGRDLFVRWAREAGCSIAIDEVGNIFARMDGRDPSLPPILSGSHLDTQATGGRFDGVFGVLAALEAVRVIAEQGIEHDHPIEVVCWTNEEGCRFAPAMLGSGVVSGVYDTEFAYAVVDKDGASFGSELERIGYRGEFPAARRAIAAAIEAHIEQGPILEAEGKTIGVVTGIQGAYWLDIVLTGQSCHAGPTPMNMRRDPWRAASAIIAGALGIADQYAPSARVTIGDMKAEPGSRNTVPERLTFPVDIRHPDASTLEEMVAKLRALVERASVSARLEHEIKQIWHMPATRFDEQLVDLIEREAGELGYSYQRIVSGAGHDSLHTAQFAPTAMIFVPCEDGLSHNEAEAARYEDIAAGANVLLRTIIRAAQNSQQQDS
ncbi:amidase, hydantoinase/carbamoylase family [Sphingobium chlorophenolicum L-1]|uniref:Amidase, hydantoinase/carbamoylase family n=1 Tax=Sphingobium chlorophenolicum L-1 TaxID=690566 RepID=F6EWZ3_SPHCR|nr:Zn-dependent hydrolase [Sphingobium chlorophenolicum]AEG48156.1 amidase, hydantoinase/carbamoylase family [Sphingobium chlorophenolicum L-1]